MENRTKISLCVAGAIFCIGCAGAAVQIFRGSWQDEAPTTAAGPACGFRRRPISSQLRLRLDITPISPAPFPIRAFTLSRRTRGSFSSWKRPVVSASTPISRRSTSPRRYATARMSTSRPPRSRLGLQPRALLLKTGNGRAEPSTSMSTRRRKKSCALFPASARPRPERS